MTKISKELTRNDQLLITVKSHACIFPKCQASPSFSDILYQLSLILHLKHFSPVVPSP